MNVPLWVNIQLVNQWIDLITVNKKRLKIPSWSFQCQNFIQWVLITKQIVRVKEKSTQLRRDHLSQNWILIKNISNLNAKKEILSSLSRWSLFNKTNSHLLLMSLLWIFSIIIKKCSKNNINMQNTLSKTMESTNHHLSFLIVKWKISSRQLNLSLFLFNSINRQRKLFLI